MGKSNRLGGSDDAAKNRCNDAYGDYANDEQLVSACNAGDSTAMTALVKHFENTVYNTAYRIVGHSSDAQDVAQSVFLKVFDNLHKFDSRYRLFSWVYRITVNEALNFSDKRKHHGDFFEQQHAATNNLETAHDNQLLGEQIQRALLELSNDYRSVIVLKHIAGCSYEEISDILELPEKTVRSRLYSARQRLQTSLRETSKEFLA